MSDPTAGLDRELVERLAVQLSGAGLSRLEGRICGAMALHPHPRITQGELVELLGATKGHVSVALRRLVELQWVGRTPVVGSRRDAYELLPDGIRSSYARSLHEIQGLRDLLEECLRARPGDARPGDRLREYRDVMAVMAEEYPVFVERVWARVERGDVPPLP